MKILVLGGTGVISKYVVKEYVETNNIVYVFTRRNRPELLHPQAIEVKVDVNKKEELKNAVKDMFFDKIIDFTTFTPDVMDMKLSVLTEKCSHYIFISTIATYEPTSAIHTEESDIFNSKWSYGYNKSLCEKTLKQHYSKSNSGVYTIIRPGLTWSEMFIPYSPFDSYNMPGYLIHNILLGKEIATLNNGEDKMQIMFAGDFAYNVKNLLDLEASKNEIFNITGDEFITSNQIAMHLSKYLNKRVILAYIPEKYVINNSRYENNIVAGGWHLEYSNNKAKSILKDYVAEVRWQDKLDIIVDYFYRYQKFLGWSKTDEKLWIDVIHEAKQQGDCKERIYDVKETMKYKNVLYEQMFQKNNALNISLEKELINNRCLKKWLYIKGKNINIFDELEKKGINDIVIYGYGILGQFAVSEAQKTTINIKYLIDKGNVALDGIECRKEFSGSEKEVVLVTVMTASEQICEYLKQRNCHNIILLEDILDNFMVWRKYPELLHYADIENTNDLQVVSFGTGMGFYDFIYDDISVNAFNFSLTQQILQMDYNLLSHYHQKMSKNCKVILTLSYCIFAAHEIEGTEVTYERYYSILPETVVKSVCERSYQKYKNMLRHMSFDMIEHKLEFQKALLSEQMELQCEETIQNWIKQLGIISFAKGDLSSQVRNAIEINKQYLRDILAFCKEKDFEPIIVIPPMSQTLLDRISMEFRQSHFYAPLYDVVGDDIQILDYSDDVKFCNPEYYGWPGFLIQNAAKEFTKDVLSKIIKQ